jgi:cyclophilin family peptidyl-prolyl cis-trans isomerase
MIPITRTQAINSLSTSLFWKLHLATASLLCMAVTASATQPRLITNIPSVYFPTNAAPFSINLSRVISADPATNLVRVTTSLSDSNKVPLGFTIQLFPSNAPQTVANFLAYVNDGAYEKTLIHRSIPGFIIQTGGYTDGGTGSTWNTPIATFTNTVPSEATNGLHNTFGTISMALVGSDSNSATDQWFVNLTNNTSILDSSNIANNPPFTVFAQVVNGMSNVAAIAGLPTCDAIENSTNPVYQLGSWLTNYGFTSSSIFYDMPLVGVTTNSPALSLSQLVYLTHVATIPYYSLSSDSASYSATISNSTLTVAYAGGTNPPPAPVTISLYAYDTNGLTTNTSFQVWNRTNVPQTISFPYTNITYSTNQFFLPGLPVATDGNSVSDITIVSAGPLYNGKNGGLYLKGPGTIVLKAVEPGSLFYQGVTNLISIKVANNQTLTFPALTTNSSNTVTYSTNPISLKATASSSLPAEYSLTGPGRISGTNLFLTGAGTLSITAGQSGNSNYFAATPLTNTLVVLPAPQTITFPPLTNQILSTSGTTFPIVPIKASASSGLPVSNTVSGAGFLTNGSIQVTGPGKVMVVSSQAGSTGYNPAPSITNSFLVGYAQHLSTFGNIPSKPIFTNPNLSFQLLIPKTDALRPTATNVSVIAQGPATINGSTVTLIGAGTVTLTATQSGDTVYLPASISTNFTVSKGTQKIAALTSVAPQTNGTSLTIPIPSSSSGLPVTISANGAGYVRSSTSTNATICFTNAGTITLTATQSGDTNYLPATLTNSISVLKGNQNITFPTIGTQTPGSSIWLSAFSSSGLPVSYKIISGTNRATLVGTNQVILSVLGGSATIVASQAGSTGYNPATPVTNSFSF